MKRYTLLLIIVALCISPVFSQSGKLGTLGVVEQDNADLLAGGVIELLNTSHDADLYTAIAKIVDNSQAIHINYMGNDDVIVSLSILRSSDPSENNVYARIFGYCVVQGILKIKNNSSFLYIAALQEDKNSSYAYTFPMALIVRLLNGTASLPDIENVVLVSRL